MSCFVKQFFSFEITNWNMEVVLADQASHNNESANSSNVNLTTGKDIESIMLENIPKATKKKRQWAVNHFKCWGEKRNDIITNTAGTSDNSEYQNPFPNKNIELFTDDELNYFLPRFILEVRSSDNDLMRPKTLMELVINIQQFINQHRKASQVKFLSDTKFKAIRDVLDGMMKMASKEGKNLVAKKADIITPEMEDTLWKMQLLGDETPDKLLCTLLFYVGINFALRGSSEHANLTVNNFSLKIIDNQRCLIYKESQSKCNQGGLKDVRHKIKEVTAVEKYNKSRKMCCESI